MRERGRVSEWSNERARERERARESWLVGWLVGWLVRGQRMLARPGPRFPPGRSLGFKPAGN